MQSGLHKNTEEPEEKFGFFRRLFGGRDPVRKRAIRILKKELSSARMDLFKIKQDIILTPIAKTLFEIYKYTYPLKQFITMDKKSKRFPPSFEEGFILCFHQPEALEVYKKLNEEYIKKLVTKHGVQKTANHVNKQLIEYFDYFDGETIHKINNIFSNFLYFARFTHFDFFPILREFDPKLEEANFIRKPSFSPAEGTFLRNDLYKLHKALYTFDADEKLDQAFKIFTDIKNFEPISKSNYNKLKNLIAGLQKNDYISLIIRAIDKSLAPVQIERPSTFDAFGFYSFKKKGDVQAILNTIKKTMKEQSVSSIVSQLFEGAAVTRVKNYTDLKNDQLQNLGLPVFSYVKPLNYAKAFITDKYKAYISKVINELIISGIFINKGILNDLSNSYYALNSHLHNITAFDNDLDSEGTSGKIIKRLLHSVKREKSARKILEKTINNVNLKAKVIIDEKVVNIKEMAYCLKNIMEDYKLKTPKIISNIKKIRTGSNKQFIEELVKTYKDIYLFLKLISNYVSISVTRAEIETEKASIKEK